MDPLISLGLLLVLIMVGYLLVAPPVMGLAIGRAGRRRGEGRPRVPRVVVPSFARYALDNKTVLDIMEKGRQFPSSIITIQDFIDLWAVPDQGGAMW